LHLKTEDPSEFLVQRLAPNDSSGWTMPGRVEPNEPPLRKPGMTCVFLDLNGRLLEFHAVPPYFTSKPVPQIDDWKKMLLQAAGLSEDRVIPLPPEHVPPVYADEWLAWESCYPDRPDRRVLVEAGAYKGRPVYFQVARGELPDRLYTEFMPAGKESLKDLFYVCLGLIALPVGGWMAWRNWTQKRANPRGATHLVACYLALALFGWFLTAKHVPSPSDEVALFAGMLGRTVVDGMMLWLAYLALEPWVRRLSPWRWIGWSRLLEGKWRDPLVGRDVLLGVLGAVGASIVAWLFQGVPTWLGWSVHYWPVWEAPFTEGAGDILMEVQFRLLVSLRQFFFFFILFLICRRNWIAAALVLIIWHFPSWLVGEYAWGELLAYLTLHGLGLFILLRFGFLAYVAYNVTVGILVEMPVTTDLSAWYASISTLSLLILAGLAVYGFLATRGLLESTRRVWADGTTDD
jgi:serine/threonine-protein kinase